MGPGARSHAVLTWLSGFETLIEVYGLRPAQTCLRPFVRRIAGRLDARDRLSRHSASGLLVFTIRISGEIQTLQAGIAGDVAAAGVDVRGLRLPRAHISFTSAGPVTDPGASIAALDALMMSLEAAVTAAAVPSALSPGPANRPPVQRTSGVGEADCARRLTGRRILTLGGVVDGIR